MPFQLDAGALVLVCCYAALACVCAYQMLLMRRARHSGTFMWVLALACALCLLRTAFFLKTMFVAGGRDVVSYSLLLGIYLLPYALFFSMNSALVVYYSEAVAKARQLPALRRDSHGSAAGGGGTRPLLGVMTVAASAIYGVFVLWLAVEDGAQDGAPRPLRWFYLLWTATSDVVICVLVKVWGDRFMAAGRRAHAAARRAAGQFGLLNSTLCLALFGRAVFAMLSYAVLLPDGLTYIYFLGNHRKLAGDRAAIFVLSECVPVAAYAGLFLHMPERKARNLSVDAPPGSYAPLAPGPGRGGDPAAPPPSFGGSASPAILVRHPAPSEAGSETASNASLAFSGTPSSYAAEQVVKNARTRALLAAPQEGVNAISPHEILQSYGRGRRS